MRISLPVAAAALAAACAAEPAPDAAPVPAPADTRPGLDWQGAVRDGGYALRLSNLATGEHLLTISCLPPVRLRVRAPRFTPIFSEDRFSFGIGGEPVTLVANPYEQPPGAGVAGEGPIPADLRALFAGAQTVSALYGSQQVGPHVAPPEALREPFLRACERLARG